jgi:sec-independent protein translocase protein TatC
MSDDDDEKRGNDPGRHQMTIWEHLEELRSRIVKMMLAFLLGAIVSWIYRKQLFGIITVPFVEAWKAARPDAPIITFPAPASLFIAYVRISAISGIVMALPIMLWQVWAFVSPGLYSREKRLAVPFVVSSCALFAGGGYFAWKVAFKLAFQFFLSMSGQVGQIEVKPSVMVSEYLDFVTNMLLAFGLMAELPVLVFFLSVAGLVTHRHLIKFFRYFIVIAFVVAAVITPPDPLSQLLLAVPLVVLYVVSILVAFIFSRRREKAADDDKDDDENKNPPSSKAAE